IIRNRESRTMKKRRRGRPNNLKNIVHDRISRDLPRHAQVARAEVDDPYEEGARIVVLRSTRHDPLAEMISKRQIDQCDYDAGRHWQAAWEHAEIGTVRALDPTREAVDGGRLWEGLTDAQRRAVEELRAAREALGQQGHQLICDVLGRARTITEAAGPPIQPRKTRAGSAMCSLHLSPRPGAPRRQSSPPP